MLPVPRMGPKTPENDGLKAEADPRFQILAYVLYRRKHRALVIIQEKVLYPRSSNALSSNRCARQEDPENGLPVRKEQHFRLGTNEIRQASNA